MAARPHVIDGKTVDPKRAVPRDQSTRSEANVSSKRLYVSGVREVHTEKMFEEYFNQFGRVLKVSYNPGIVKSLSAFTERLLAVICKSG